MSQLLRATHLPEITANQAVWPCTCCAGFRIAAQLLRSVRAKFVALLREQDIEAGRAIGGCFRGFSSDAR